MKPAYGPRSLRVREQLDLSMVAVFDSLLVDGIDHSLLESYRSRETHQKYLDKTPPVTTVTYEESDHRFLPSPAVDAVPWVTLPGLKGGIHWHARDPKVREKYWQQMCFFAGVVVMRGDKLGVKIQWGGDWDRDWSVMDTRFFDAPHFCKVN